MRASATRVEGEVLALRLETPFSRALSYCAYANLVDGLLVDSGFVRAQGQLLAALAGERVERVVNTHVHEDHVGNNREIAERFGAEVAAPAAGLAGLGRPERIAVLPYQRLLWGRPSRSAAAPLGAEVRTPRFRFDVVPTPGHSQDHVAFHEPERGWLFSGDLYLGSQVRLARPFENAADLVASLERVIALRPRILFCGHRGPLEDPLQALGRKLGFLSDLREKALALHRSGAPAEEIAARLAPGEPLGFFLFTFGDLSRRNFVRSLLKAPGEGYEPGRADAAHVPSPPASAGGAG
jgi:glyoxylase-like metal-dependent hydrolase (beta-lactamase superfamily II)